MSDDALADAARLVERYAARVAFLERERNELELELAYSLDDVFNLGHELKSAATAVRLAKQHAAAYREQRDAVMARLGKAQQCTHEKREEVAA